jgi:hypothetical protein
MRHLVVGFRSTAMAVTLASLLVASGALGGDGGMPKRDSLCDLEESLMGDLSSESLEFLKSHGVVWVSPPTVSVDGGSRHLFLGEDLFPRCESRAVVAGFLEGVLLDRGPDPATFLSSSDVGEESIVSAVVLLWGTEEFWIDGLRDNRSRLLFALGEYRYGDLVSAVVARHSVDGDIAHELLGEVPRSAVPSLIARERNANSCCEQLWISSILSNNGLGGSSELPLCRQFPRVSDCERRAWQLIRMAIDDPDLDVSWEMIADAGCWE